MSPSWLKHDQKFMLWLRWEICVVIPGHPIKLEQHPIKLERHKMWKSFGHLNLRSTIQRCKNEIAMFKTLMATWGSLDWGSVGNLCCHDGNQRKEDSFQSFTNFHFFCPPIFFCFLNFIASLKKYSYLTVTVDGGVCSLYNCLRFNSWVRP